MSDLSIIIAQQINKSRLLSLLKKLSSFGQLKNGGVNRQALSEQDLLARQWIIEYVKNIGCNVYTDHAANLFIRRDGKKNKFSIMTGSHIDTQPNGGNLDGCYGVIAGLEILTTLHENNIILEHPIEVVIWTNEEGCRFSPGTLGSCTFVTPQILSHYLLNEDDKNIKLKDALEYFHNQFKIIEKRPNLSVHSFVELHIEQGPILERKQKTIGIVDSIQGVRWYEVTCCGFAAHAGTTPMSYKEDAMLLAQQVIQQLSEKMQYIPKDELRLTFGRWSITPNSINTIPSSVVFTIDFRHQDNEILNEFDSLIREIENKKINVKPLFSHETVKFSPQLIEIQKESCSALNIDHDNISSGAFHDAMYLAEYCPTCMFFVPSHLGISHNPAEYTDPEDLYKGTQVLTHYLINIANQ